MRFHEKVVVVTGGASGIGYSTAKLFAAAGARVAINDARSEAVDQAVEAIRAVGGDALAVPGDVSDIDSVNANVDEILKTWGRIDVLVCSAGVYAIEPPETASAEGWRRTMAVNVDGPFFWSQAVAARSMIPSGGGAIIIVSSIAGLGGIANNAAYVTSKHAAIGLTRSLAVDWGKYGIRVNALCPGLTETPMVKAAMDEHPERYVERRKRIPVGHSATPEDQAEAILFLASPQASSVHGLIMAVDGGTSAMSGGATVGS